MKNLTHSLLFCFSLLAAACLSSCEVISQNVEQSADVTSNEPCSTTTKKKCSDSQLAKNIFDIFEDKQGNLWFGTHDKGVAKYDGKSLTYISEEDGLCGKTVADMAQDKDGVLWFGTHGDMCLFDLDGSDSEGEMSFTTFEKNGDVPHLGYGWKSVKTDPEGNIWVNSHHGIFRYENGAFTEFKVPTEAEGKPSFCSTPGGVSFDLTDSKGNMWFSTDGDGAYKYDGKTFSHFSEKDGLSSNSVISIAEDKNGNIWFACRENMGSGDNNGGVSMYDGKSFLKFKKEKGLDKNNINTIYADKSGNIWIGATGAGIYKHNGTDFTFYPEPSGVDLSDNFSINGLQSILEDSKGTMWLGFSGGLYRLDNESLVNVTQGMLGGK